MNKLKKSWQPTKPVSKGAEMYHNAVINTSWYNDNLQPIIPMFNEKLLKNSIVVDFGAGTGISSIFLLDKIKLNFKLLLVDNSPSWLGKAYELLKDDNRVDFYILEKIADKYNTLAETIGFNTAHLVVSANTIHLIPNLKEMFKGMYDSLRPNGYVILQSGNIKRKGRKNGVLMIENTVEEVHGIAINLIKTENKFSKYKGGLNKRIKDEQNQRRLIFPDPRNISVYRNVLTKIGFKDLVVKHQLIRVKYDDWIKFLRIRRIQAGILPEIGGRNPSIIEENDRDAIITLAIEKYFNHLKKDNPLATKSNFITEWTYIKARKSE